MESLPIGGVGGEALLHAAMASMPYGFSVWDDAMRLVVFNQTYLDMYDLPADLVRPGLSLRGLAEINIARGSFPDLDVDGLFTRYLARFSGDPDRKVTEHHAGDRIIRSTITRMPAIGWVATHQDITGEVESAQLAASRELALARQNLRFQAAVGNMPQGLCMVSPDLRLVVCNDLFTEMYGLPPELSAPGTPLHEIIDYRISREAGAAARDGAVGPRRLHLVGGRTIRFVERVAHRTIAVTQQPLDDGGWVSIHQDITEQQRREELIQARTLALEVQNIRFEAAVNNMLHGLCMFDAESRLIVCNRQYAEMYGLSAHLTRPGTSFWDMLEDGERSGMVSIADRNERLRILGAVIEAGKPYKNNVTMLNGRVIAILHQPMPGGGWIATHEDVTEQHRHEQGIRHLARHDALTDLPNRVLFREEMARIEARTNRNETVALLLVDLDHFKAVNDTFGHAVGDEVLVEVARRLHEASRESDVVARLGGDEFAVLAGALDHPKHAAAIAERIVGSVGRPLTVDGHAIDIGASVGIAVAPFDGVEPDRLLRNADLALYRAKAEGRGAFHFFESGMDDEMRRRRGVEAELRFGLANAQFRLVFQPMLRLDDNRIEGLEALLRWNHPQRGAITPSEFLPIADESGLLIEIGDWVLHEACRAAARWPDDIGVAVNLSAVQFRHRGLLALLQRALRASGLAPHRLELEITEAVLLADPNGALETLHRLRAMGVKVSVDDFGGGHASLRWLIDFPFDKLKVDRSLVASLERAHDPMGVVAAMIGLGRSLGIDVVAEGIETEEQLAAVRAAGCTLVQGYLFSLPLPASGIDALLGAVRAGEARRRGELRATRMKRRLAAP